MNISKLEPALEGDIYAIYTDYHSDYRGDYGFALATQEPRTEMMIPITPNIDYHVFDVVDRDVAGTWKYIWELEDAGLLNRAYTIDYERYKDRWQYKNLYSDSVVNKRRLIGGRLLFACIE
ncbi:hypothetical protein MGH68_06270 [Erysipelothrix sp. D19-032]